MQYASLCCIAKDEDMFLPEWITYHAVLGFEHFIVYDNCSTTPIAELLAPWVQRNMVTVVHNGQERSQLFAYDDCLQRFGNRFRWIAFLDVDEFICLNHDSHLFTFLAHYEPYAGVGLNWRMFSSSGHETPPPGLLIENYLHYTLDDVHIKSIIQPAHITRTSNPHAFRPQSGYYCVTPEHTPIPAEFPFTVPCMSEAYINHYFYKSRACFAEKIAKGNPCNITRRMQEFDDHLTLPTRKDSKMLRYVNEVKALLAEKKLPTSTALPQNTENLIFAAHKLLENNETTSAQICLCYASLQATSGELSLIWALRSEIARKNNRLPLAGHCMNQAFIYEPTQHSLLEMTRLFQQQGKLREAKTMLHIAKIFFKDSQ